MLRHTPAVRGPGRVAGALVLAAALAACGNQVSTRTQPSPSPSTSLMASPSPEPSAFQSPLPSPSAAPSPDPTPVALALPPAQAPAPGCAPSLPRRSSTVTAPGQLVVVTFAGHEVTPRLRDLVQRGHVAGVLLFRTNFADSTALGVLDAQLQAIQARVQPGVPLVVMIDQEGGRVRHVADAPPLAAAAAEATLGPVAVQASMARTARALRRVGVGIDLAPVADVRTNASDRVIGDRAYGNSPGVATPFIAAAVRGLHEGGEGAVLKHFPGLGGAAGDPHVAMPTDYESAADWRRLRLPGFAAGIAAGADAVMTTALVEPALDPTGTPAMLSRTMTTALLRDQLGFGGVIMTDSLAMDGLKPYGSLPQLTVKAVQAGADMVLLGSGDLEDEGRSIDALGAAIAAGSISADQVARSTQRNLALRLRWGACR